MRSAPWQQQRNQKAWRQHTIHHTCQNVRTCIIYIYISYKVPLREVPRGVAQERNNNRRMKSCTSLEVVAVSTHHWREEHTRIFLRTDYIILFAELVWGHYYNNVPVSRYWSWTDDSRDKFNVCGVNVSTIKVAWGRGCAIVFCDRLSKIQQKQYIPTPK